MATTQAGDLVELLQQKALERMITGSQAHYSLLTKAYLQLNKPQASDQMLTAISEAFVKLSPQLATMMQKATSSLIYLESGKRPAPVAPRATDPNSLLATIKSTTNLAAFKKAGGYGGALSPQQLEQTYSYAGQSIAQVQTLSAHEIIQRQAEHWDNTQGYQGARYARIPEPGACKFCLMLVRRGAVYTDSGYRFHSHGSCKCIPVLAFEGWTLPPEKQKILDEADKEIERESYQEQKARKAGNEQLVKYGYRKRVVKQTPKMKTEVLDDGTTRTYQEGIQTRVTYVKTQKARDLEQAKSYKDTPAYRKIMAPKDKPLAHSSIPPETAAEELSRLRYDLGMVDEDGNLLGAVDSSESYTRWAKNVGVWDEKLIEQAKVNHGDHVDAWYELNRRNELDKALTRARRISPRINRIDSVELSGEVKSFEFWRKRLKENDTDTLSLSLRQAGVVYTGGPDIPDPTLRKPRTPKVPPSPMVQIAPSAAKLDADSNLAALNKQFKSTIRENSVAA